MIEKEEVLLNELIEIKLKNSDDFLKICETLTRMGIASYAKKHLYQSCHILHKKGKYYILHFKQMFLLDGKTADVSKEDIQRTKLVAKLLENWDLLELVTPISDDIKTFGIKLDIISYKNKKDFTLVPKYTIGK